VEAGAHFIARLREEGLDHETPAEIDLSHFLAFAERAAVINAADPLSFFVGPRGDQAEVKTPSLFERVACHIESCARRIVCFFDWLLFAAVLPNLRGDIRSHGACFGDQWRKPRQHHQGSDRCVKKGLAVFHGDMSFLTFEFSGGAGPHKRQGAYVSRRSGYSVR